MKVVFTSSGAKTLCDDTASPKIAGVIEGFSGASALQGWERYNAANKGLRAAGNVGGQFVFTAECSYANYGAAATAWKTIYGYLNLQGSLVLTYGGTDLTMANAILRQAQRVKWQGVLLQVRYTFEITTIT